MECKFLRGLDQVLTGISLHLFEDSTVMGYMMTLVSGKFMHLGLSGF